MFCESVRGEDTRVIPDRLLDMAKAAREGEATIACGRASTNDFHYIYRYLGCTVQRFWSDRREEHDRNEEWDFWNSIRMERVKMPEEPLTRAHLKMPLPPPEKFKREDDLWTAQWEKERQRRLLTAEEDLAIWKRDMRDRLAFLRAHREKPFGESRPVGMSFSRWFQEDPRGLLPLLARFRMSCYPFPFAALAAEWLILPDEDDEVLEVAATDLISLDCRKRLIGQLCRDTEIKRPERIRVCVYSEAFEAAKRLLSEAKTAYKTEHGAV